MNTATKIGIFNGCALNITLRMLLEQKQQIIDILQSHLNSANIAEQEAIYASLFYLQNADEQEDNFRKALISNNEAEKLGMSEALYRVIRIGITPLDEEIKDRFWYLKTYRPYRLTEIYEVYSHRLLNQSGIGKAYITKKFDDILSLCKDNPDYYYERALLYTSDNKLLEAKLSVEKAISLLPDKSRYSILLAEIEYSLKNFEQSKKILSEMEQEEQNPVELEKIALLYYKMNYLQKAITIYKKLFLQKPYSKEYTISIIFLYCKELDTKNAVLYANWLKSIAKRKHHNTNNINDLFTKKDLDKEEFILIKDRIW